MLNVDHRSGRRRPRLMDLERSGARRERNARSVAALSAQQETPAEIGILVPTIPGPHDLIRRAEALNGQRGDHRRQRVSSSDIGDPGGGGHTRYLHRVVVFPLPHFSVFDSRGQPKIRKVSLIMRVGGERQKTANSL